MLRVCTIVILLLSFSTLLAHAASDQPYHPVPIIKAIDPDTAKPGDVLTATGSNLDQSALSKLFIIQGQQKTIEVIITDETASALKFKVPADVAPGRYQLMILTRGAVPVYLEEPVFFTVE